MDEKIREYKITIARLRQHLHSVGYTECETCSRCIDNTHSQTCRYCKDNCDFCSDCSQSCSWCNKNYCNQHYEDHVMICDLCQKEKCYHITNCEFCEKIYCDECFDVEFQCDCGTWVCNNCLVKTCPRLNEYCGPCHLKRCDVCWASQYFRYLPSIVQKEIYMLLLVYTRFETKRLIPPKYVNYIIFRYLVGNDSKHVEI